MNKSPAMRYLVSLIWASMTLIFGGWVISPAFGFQLVTEAEYIADRDANPSAIAPRMRSLPVSGAPKIEIIAPAGSANIKPPITIEVRFSAEPPAQVQPETLRLLYGAFRLNVTDRIRGKAKVTSDGISAPDATLPSGTHRLFIGISDSAGRYSEREVRFTVD